MLQCRAHQVFPAASPTHPAAKHQQPHKNLQRQEKGAVVHTYMLRRLPAAEHLYAIAQNTGYFGAAGHGSGKVAVVAAGPHHEHLRHISAPQVMRASAR
jgi:hypothetical protein